MIGAERVVEMAREVSSEQGGPVRIVWHVVESHTRREFAEGIRESRGDALIIPLVPEGGRFVDVNSLASDFVRTLEENRNAVEADLDSVTVLRNPVVFVLVSRRELPAAAGPSPARLPDWFPHLGGREVQVAIRDSLRDLRMAGMNEAAVRVRDVCALLYDLEVALVRRIRLEIDRNGRDAADALARLGLLRPGSAVDTLVEWERWLARVTEPGNYRIDVRQGSSPLALVVRVIAGSSPDALSSKEQELSERLSLPDRGGQDLPLVAVLYRPISVRGTPESIHGLFMSVFAAYNLINAAAHAAEYPRFGIGVLVLSAREVRRGLQMAIESLGK